MDRSHQCPPAGTARTSQRCSLRLVDDIQLLAVEGFHFNSSWRQPSGKCTSLRRISNSDARSPSPHRMGSWRQELLQLVLLVQVGQRCRSKRRKRWRFTGKDVRMDGGCCHKLCHHESWALSMLMNADCFRRKDAEAQRISTTDEHRWTRIFNRPS
jgi:hypothetical protein